MELRHLCYFVAVGDEQHRQFRENQPDVELQLKPLSSLQQIEAIRSGQLDAGFLFKMANIERELAQHEVDVHRPHAEWKRLNNRRPQVGTPKSAGEGVMPHCGGAAVE